MSKSMPMRVQSKTRRAINLLVGEMQLETGETVSQDAAVWTLIELYRPDLAEKAAKLEKEGKHK